MSLSAWEAIHLNAQTPKGRDLNQVASPWLTDHELRWAIRDGIARMYDHLGLELQLEEQK